MLLYCPHITIYLTNIHSCEYCDHKATTKRSLRQHVQSIHNEFKHSCEYCDYKATTKSSLCQHVQSIHDVVIVVSIVTIKQIENLSFINMCNLSMIELNIVLSIVTIKQLI